MAAPLLQWKTTPHFALIFVLYPSWQQGARYHGRRHPGLHAPTENRHSVPVANSRAPNGRRAATAQRFPRPAWGGAAREARRIRNPRVPEAWRRYPRYAFISSRRFEPSLDLVVVKVLVAGFSIFPCSKSYALCRSSSSREPPESGRQSAILVPSPTRLSASMMAQAMGRPSPTPPLFPLHGSTPKDTTCTSSMPRTPVFLPALGGDHRGGSARVSGGSERRYLACPGGPQAAIRPDALLGAWWSCRMRASALCYHRRYARAS